MIEILIAIAAVVSAGVLAIHHRESISDFFGEVDPHPSTRGVRWVMITWLLFMGGIIGFGICDSMHQPESATEGESQAESSSGADSDDQPESD